MVTNSNRYLENARDVPSVKRPWRVATLIERPIPFYVPHYRSLQKDPDIELDVLYLSDAGLTPFLYHDVRIEYSSEILQGYRSVVLAKMSTTVRSLRGLLRLMLRLRKIFTREKYDAVWIHGYNMPGHWAAFAVCAVMGVPMMLRGESELMFKRGLSRRMIKAFAFHLLFPRISAFLYIGKLNREFYLSYGVPEHKLIHMPYGIDNAWFEGSSEDERAFWRRKVRARLGISEDTIVFINHSKHRLPKRPADVVRAFSQLGPRTDVALILVGDGDERSEVDAACAELMAGQQVFRLGFQSYDELRRTLAASDVLAFASEENWGMAVNEGLAAGLAILCSDRVAGMMDMVEDGKNGFCFKSRDIKDLATRMRVIADDRILLDQMKAASRQKAKDFSFEAMNTGLKSALQRLYAS